ncbi:MAG: outer membrane protein assembly factor BamD [Candidatus Parabeggiatoa sp. nov. 1]|nr:MAG: outer membrane protein assembly factor BamD [Gammaproteobacteria bacterium]
MKPITLIITLCALLNLSGCGLEPKTDTWSNQRLYSEAKESLDAGDYATAIKYYEILEARFPFETYAQQAQLDLIYAYYKYEEPESAIVTASRFIKYYPRHPYVDYAYYLKGLVNFQRNLGALDRLLPIDHSQRDQKTARESLQDFAELIERFPNSKYSQDARQRMIHLSNRLADQELHVARFYMKRGAYVAAANRAKTVIQSHQRTPAVPEALVILAKSYKIMGLNDLSGSALKVLKLNYPEHKGIAEVENLVVK